MQQIKGFMNQVKAAQNPQAMLNQLMMNNPNMKTAMTLIQQSGNDPKATFYALAKQMGVNPNDVLNALR